MDDHDPLHSPKNAEAEAQRVKVRPDTKMAFMMASGRTVL